MITEREIISRQPSAQLSTADWRLHSLIANTKSIFPATWINNLGEVEELHVYNLDPSQQAAPRSHSNTLFAHGNAISGVSKLFMLHLQDDDTFTHIR